MPDEDVEPAPSPSASDEDAAIASTSEPEDDGEGGEDDEEPHQADASRPDDEVREGMRVLDPRERKWGFIASGFVLALSLLYLPELVHNTYSSPTKKPTGTDHCGSGFHLVGKVCDTIYHPSDYVLQFCILVVLGGAFLVAVWRAKRTLSIFLSMLAGLASTFVGGVVVLVVGLGYGGWLLARSWRLQRYGTTDTKEVRKVVTERSEAKRAARRAGKPTPDASPTASRTKVEASKRYTPKAKPRRR